MTEGLPGALVGERSVRMTRVLDASPERVYRAWSSPEELTTWFPYQVEGSLAPGTRSVLIWPAQRVWWDVLEADPDRRFRFRWAWLEGDDFETEVTVDLEPRGYGTALTLTDGVFDLARAGVIDAYAEAVEGWAEALGQLQARLDFAIDLRRGV